MDLAYGAWWHKDDISICYQESSSVRSPLTDAAVVGSMARAAAEWSKQEFGLRYRLVITTRCETADIKVLWNRGSAFSTDEWLGMTTSKSSIERILGVTIHLNADDTGWCKGLNPEGGKLRQEGCYSVYDTIVHEVGHALGLDHSEDDKSFMVDWSSPYTSETAIRSVTPADLETLQKYYGLNTAVVTAAP
jgi:predicted Zn-dependent protease